MRDYGVGVSHTTRPYDLPAGAAGLCTARVSSARRKGSFRVAPCRRLSPEQADEPRETLDGPTYPLRLSRRRSRVRVPSTPPFFVSGEDYEPGMEAPRF